MCKPVEISDTLEKMQLNMENWKLQQLGDLISLEYGAGLPEAFRVDGDFPVYGSNGQIGNHENFLVQGPGIIVGRKGTVGGVIWTDSSFWPIDTTYYVKLRKSLHLHWCYRLLLSLPLNSMDSSTGVPGLNRNDVYQVWVNVPPFSEQSLIAQILDTLDTQIQQTEALIAKLKQIKVGLLHDLLTRGIDENGERRDLVVYPEKFKEVSLSRRKIKIPKTWMLEPLNTFLAGIDAGKSPICLDQPAGAEEWGILKVSAIHPNGFKAEENKVITNLRYVNVAYEVQDGDLLISRANTYELVGMVCLVRNPRPQLLLCDKTLRLHINSKKALSEYIFYILQMPFVRSQIEMHATGSSGSMKNISQSTIKGLSIYVPPLEEQRRIVAILNSHDAHTTAEESHLAKLKQIKKGLMDDLLTGKVRVTELVAGDECLSV